MSNTVSKKIFHLASFLGVNKSEIEQSRYDDDTFECGNQAYLVLTDSEADDKCRERILDSVWAFRSEFLSCHLKKGVDRNVVKLIQSNDKYESNNAAILSLIGDVDHFVDDAIRSDGRGHFLSRYDGEENEVFGKTFRYYIYRVN